MKGKINNGQSSTIEQGKKNGKQWLSTTHLLLCPLLSYASAPYLFWTVARNQTWTKLNGGNWLWADSVWEHSPSSSPAGDPLESWALPGQREGHMSSPGPDVLVHERGTQKGLLTCPSLSMSHSETHSQVCLDTFTWTVSNVILWSLLEWQKRCFYFFPFLSLKYTLTYALELCIVFFSVGLCFPVFSSKPRMEIDQDPDAFWITLRANKELHS